MAYLETIFGVQGLMSACKLQEIDSLPLVADVNLPLDLPHVWKPSMYSISTTVSLCVTYEYSFSQLSPNLKGQPMHMM